MPRTIRGADGLARYMKRVPREMEDNVQDRDHDAAEEIAQEARRNVTTGIGVARVAKYLAPTIEARDGTVTMGGTRSLPPRNGRVRSGDQQTVGAIMWGAEMGSSRYRQFSPWRGEGYILGPAVDVDELVEEAADAAVDAYRTA